MCVESFVAASIDHSPCKLQVFGDCPELHRSLALAGRQKGIGNHGEVLTLRLHDVLRPMQDFHVSAVELRLPETLITSHLFLLGRMVSVSGWSHRASTISPHTQ